MTDEKSFHENLLLYFLYLSSHNIIQHTFTLKDQLSSGQCSLYYSSWWVKCCLSEALGLEMSM